MNIINITVKQAFFYGYTVMIDGEPVKLKKDGKGNYFCRYKTEKSDVELSVCKILEINGRFWFLWAMMFYIIGLLGIFSSGHDRKCFCVDYKVNLTLKEQNNAELQFNKFADGQRAVTCFCDFPNSEIQNRYYIDMRAKKRLKILRIAYLLLWLAAIAAIVFAIVSALT